MFRWLLLIIFVVSLSVPAQAQFGGRKFGIGMFGGLVFGVNSFEDIANDDNNEAGTFGFILGEDSTFLLTEDGDKILLE